MLFSFQGAHALSMLTNGEGSSPSQSEQARSPRSISSSCFTSSVISLAGLTTDLQLCVICQLSRKAEHGKRYEYQPMRMCEQISPTALLRAIEPRQDEHLMRCFVHGFDAVAADVVYHRSCYKSFTNPRSLRLLEDDVSD